MSENEKMLRRLFGARAWNDAQEAELNDILDAFLAEHRAEVEALQDELKRANQSWASARDAALEEGAEGLERILAHTELMVSRQTLQAAIDHLRALKSRPASVVPVENVRGEARRLITEHLTSEAEVRAVATLADAVGANVDNLLPPERVATSQENPADPDACPRAKGVRHVWAPASGGWRQCMECHKAVKVTS